MKARLQKKEPVLILLKIFNKGQVVIPVAIRREWGVNPGDYVQASFDQETKNVVMAPPSNAGIASNLAGSLASYSKSKKFPTKKQKSEALLSGLAHKNHASSLY